MQANTSLRQKHLIVPAYREASRSQVALAGADWAVQGQLAVLLVAIARASSKGVPVVNRHMINGFAVKLPPLVVSNGRSMTAGV